MNKKDIDYIDDNFGELAYKTESLKTVANILRMATNYINSDQLEQEYTFKAIEILANDLCIHINDFQGNFFRLIKEGGQV